MNLSDWHALDVEEVIDELKSNQQLGLTTQEAKKRFESYGPNVLKKITQHSWYKVLARQFFDVLIFILFVAAIIALMLGKVGDAATILAIIILNGILGFVQEWRAEKAMEALRKMLSLRCKVVRDGISQEIDADQLVPGDIVLLEIGDRVPADLRLIKTVNLKVDESSLTGESISVNKDTESMGQSTILSARSSMVYMGTAVTNGFAHGVVVSTGMLTEFGQIAELTQTVKSEMTPLQRKLARLGKQLGIFAIAISILVSITGLVMGKSLIEMFFTGVSLAVAIVPEGLPIVVTITMALGIRVMAKRRALVRRLQAAETLGAATVICTDKTGTLTQNEMTVTKIWLPAGEVNVVGIGYDPAGHFRVNDEKIDYRQRKDLLALLETGIICNHAKLYKDENGWHQLGEPTEAALVTVAYKAWLTLSQELQAISEFSFNSQRKRMTVIMRHGVEDIAHVKGAPEIILNRCRFIQDGDIVRRILPEDKKRFENAYITMAKSGLRTLALARRTISENIALKEDEVERDLILLGVVGIIDPPRLEVEKALRVAHDAGIKTIMVTGDAGHTAIAIAQRIHMKAERAATGAELEEMNDEVLLQALNEGAIFARTSPEHKLRIVKLLQKQGHVVGMTGDGVNDAPALKKADIGISMGIRGTDVAKSASDMILTDDNFASIIGAIKEGRRQYANIQKFVQYLLSSNTGEVIAIFFNILLGGPLILLPVQILWINLITDGVTAMALGVEPAEQGIMKQSPRLVNEPILDRTGMVMILILGGYIGLVTLGLFHFYLNSADPSKQLVAQTLAFTGMIMLEKMNVFNFRSFSEPIFKIGFLSNPWILISVLSMIGLQVCAVYVPFLQHMLHTVPLGWSDWGLLVVVALPIFLLMEIWKVVRTR